MATLMRRALGAAGPIRRARGVVSGAARQPWRRVTFLLATQRGYLTVSGVLASLYPAFTILLAAVILKEHIHRAQGVGLVLCGLAVGLVAAS